jgi:hypothetical protein
MIDIIFYEQNYYKPRMYRQKARKDYLNLAKCKKRTAKKIRKVIKAQFSFIIFKEQTNALHCKIYEKQVL